MKKLFEENEFENYGYYCLNIFDRIKKIDKPMDQASKDTEDLSHKSKHKQEASTRARSEQFLKEVGSFEMMIEDSTLEFLKC